MIGIKDLHLFYPGLDHIWVTVTDCCEKEFPILRLPGRQGRHEMTWLGYACTLYIVHVYTLYTMPTQKKNPFPT
jgi:hypothetical protein